MESSTSAPTDRLVERALGWIESNFEYFEPFQGGIEPDGYREKALMELAILCMCLYRVPRFSSNALVHRFLKFIAEAYSAPLYRERLFRVEGAFVPHALLIVALDTCGYLVDDPLRDRFQALVERSCISFVERVPYRALEVRHILDVGSFRHSLPSYSALCRSSMAVKPLNVIYMTDSDAYSITHALIYLSDFGSRPIPALRPAELKRLRWTLEHLLGMYIHKRDWDITGELLLSCQAVDWTTSDFYALGWRAMLDAQQLDGAFPGPTFKQEDMEGLDEGKRREYLFKQDYHTTLVAALFGALCKPPATGESNAA
jgi:hypothetical protein